MLSFRNIAILRERRSVHFFRKVTMRPNPFVLHLICYWKKVFVFVFVIVNVLSFSSAKLQHQNPEVNTLHMSKTGYFSSVLSRKIEPSIASALQREKLPPPRWRHAVTAVKGTRHRGGRYVSPR